MSAEKNQLYFGDNLDVLRRYIKDESVDLVYLDPPFNSRQDYNVLFAEKDGSRSSSQIHAFEDTWEWNRDAMKAYEEVVEKGGRVAETMRSFWTLLRGTDMMAYLAMMAPRLIELRRVLKQTGSIYLHCDPTASHYLKILMDGVFGPQLLVNEIVWKRYGAHNDVGQGSKHLGRVHDTLLFYSKSDARTWSQVFVPLSEEYIRETYRNEDENGKFTTTPLTGPGGERKGNPVYEWNGHTRAWRYSKKTMERLDKEGRLYYSKTGYPRQKLYLTESKGVPVQDVWSDVKSLSGAFAERLGYPTQKPESLLERILLTSSVEGDLVLDPFCGCGTTVQVAQRLNRQWIGIDVTHLAINLIKARLRDGFGEEIKAKYEVIGEPIDLEGARELAASPDKYQFQSWALGLCYARPTEGIKKGADRGIDGRQYIHDDESGESKQILYSVKAGHVTVSQVRDLRGVLERENAQIGVFLCFEDPTKPMLREAAEAGLYKSSDGSTYQRLQILTVQQLLNGKQPDFPRHRREATFKKAPRSRPEPAKNLSLPLVDE